MSPERWQRIDELFGRALELEPDDRGALLDAECGEDRALREDVEAMLAFSRAAAGFLETPPVEELTAVLGGRAEASGGLRVPSDESRFVPGDIVAGRYRIAGILGRGGMGEVYRADDLRLGQPVALKFLSETLARDGAALARFHREVSLARQVSHRHVCRVYDIGEHGGMHFLSMELVRGEELGSLLRRVGRLPVEKATETARQLCAGLAAIHAAGVLHRDLKPANIMIDERGDVRITDFGVAALSDQTGTPQAVIGTPAYMAPEQLARGEVSVRSDLYALGLVLYEAFTGSRPFSGTTLEEVLRERLTETQPDLPSRWIPAIDPAVERAILRCLEHDAAERPASAIEVAALLPGGDPLAAALEAGETPSPQMVAASARRGPLRPRSALLLAAWIGFSVVALTALAPRTMLHPHLGIGPPPEVLRGDALSLAEAAGYPFRDAASGFRLDRPLLLHLEETKERWQGFFRRPQPLLQFVVLTSPDPLVPGGRDPAALATPLSTPGMTSMRFDTAGRLLSFEAVPRPAAGVDAAVGWETFFRSAGFDPSRFRSSPPEFIPPQYADRLLAWTGRDSSGAELRVEAASVRGRPVWFRVAGPWTPPPDRGNDTGGDADALTLLLFSLYFGAIAFSGVLSWRNLRLGRGDRRGTVRLMSFVFAARIVYWLFAGHHVHALDEVLLAVDALKGALYWAAVVGLLYLSLEPFLRRRWPRGLVSWTRLLGGELRDPLVGRDVLVGGAFGLAAIATLAAFSVVPPLAGGGFRRPAVNSELLYEHGLAGVRGFFPLLVNQTSAAITFPLILAAVLVFFTLVTRKLAVAGAVTWAVLYAVVVLNFGAGATIDFVLAALFPSIVLLVLVRYGLLALVATFFYLHLWPFYPMTTKLDAWYATTFVLQVSVLSVLTLWAVRTSVGGQRLVSGDWMES
jgi:predicted Ser/Thr protein kinase